MAKLKFKLSPAGILFLIATLVLIIALVSVIIVLGKSCKSNDTNRETAAESSALPASSTDEPEPVSTEAETSSPEPEISPEPTQASISGLEPISTSDANNNSSNNIPVAPTQAAAATATPSATDKIYTSPTKAQKNAAKDGYVSKDKVNMRKGPGTKYDTVKSDIAKNTAVTLYEQQGDWWFLKCGSNYGYIRKDMITVGKAPSTPSANGSSDSYDGTIKTNSVAALRKEASTSSKCLKELKNGDKVTVYYKTKDKSGNYWYYVKYNNQKGYIYSTFVSTSKKVPAK